MGQYVTVNIQLNLTADWLRGVAAGTIIAPFVDEVAGKSRWGVQMTVTGPEYFVEYGTGPREPAGVEEEVLQGRYRKIYHPFRRRRPGVTPLVPGSQKVPTATATDCPFGCHNHLRELSLLRRDVVASFMVQNGALVAYANAAPFSRFGHFIWLLALRSCYGTYLPHAPQSPLTRRDLDNFVHLARACSDMVLFHNGLQAGASVFHLHFQSFAYTHSLAVESAEVERFGRLTMLKGYPAQGLRFDLGADHDLLWDTVNRFQESGVPLNIIAVNKARVFVFPRNPEHEVADALPGGAIASAELAGMVITGDRAVYDNLTSESIARGLAQTTKTADEIRALLADIAGCSPGGTQ